MRNEVRFSAVGIVENQLKESTLTCWCTKGKTGVYYTQGRWYASIITPWKLEVFALTNATSVTNLWSILLKTRIILFIVWEVLTSILFCKMAGPWNKRIPGHGFYLSMMLMTRHSNCYIRYKFRKLKSQSIHKNNRSLWFWDQSCFLMASWPSTYALTSHWANWRAPTLLANKISNSSKVFPLVSGRRKNDQTKKTAEEPPQKKPVFPRQFPAVGFSISGLMLLQTICAT